MDKEIFLLLLDKEFYTNYKGMVIKDLFVEQLQPLYATLTKAHEQYDTITLKDIWLLHLSDNPMITGAKKAELQSLFNSMADSPAINPSLGRNLLVKVWEQYYYGRITDASLKIMEGVDVDVNKAKIKEYTDKLHGVILPDENSKIVTNDLDELLDQIAQSYRWKFNLPALHSAVGNIGGGMFCEMMARTDAGKTACWVSMAAGPEGWMEQGAKVLVIGNEEDQKRTVLRCINSSTGITSDEFFIRNEKGDIIGKRDDVVARAKIMYSRHKDNLTIIDDPELTIDQLSSLIARHKPDILIIDQIDKIKIKGSFDRRDIMFSELYIQVRAIGKKYMPEGFIIGITQASADAHGKLHYGFEATAESKTGKPAEADIIITIGMKALAATDGIDDGSRTINLPKLKTFNGKKEPINFRLNTSLSRMIP